MGTKAGGGFPFQNSSAGGVFASLPDGMTINKEVMHEFLHPPDSPYEWFLQQVWEGVSEALENDDAVSAADYTAIQKAFNSTRDLMVDWTNRRDPNTTDPKKGWGVVSMDMGTSGRDAYVNMKSVQSIAARLGPTVEAETAAALSDLTGVLSEYAGCMALELEAGQDQVPVTDLLTRVNDGVTNPWKLAVTPSNIGDMSIGSHRLPAPDPPDAGFWKNLGENSDSTPDDATPWVPEGGDDGGERRR